MPSQDLRSLKATRIAEAQSRVEAAVQSREQALKRTLEAQASLSAAPNEEAKKGAELALAAANRDLENEEARLAFERSGLDRLLQGGEASAAAAMSSWQYGIFGGLALVMLVFLMYGIVNQTLLISLAGIATARGLITFLIAVVTVTIALILTISTVVSESDEREKRFTQGKEILTALIGVLGTIVGFYFGQAGELKGAPEIAPVYVSKTKASEGETIDLSTFVYSGNAPYTYDVSFTPPIVPPIQNQKSANGAINVSLTAPHVDETEKVWFEIRAKDNDGKTRVYSSDSEGKVLQFDPKPLSRAGSKPPSSAGEPTSSANEPKPTASAAPK